MKRSNLSYQEWKCILQKKMYGKQVNESWFRGYIGLIDIGRVTEPQVWNCNGKDITVCKRGRRWLTLLPWEGNYCITAMMNRWGKVLLWYIDMIAAQGVGEDGIPWFDDLYLDLVVFPDGHIHVDDRDELEAALAEGDITQEQFDLALRTAEELQTGLLSDMAAFQTFTRKAFRYICKEKSRVPEGF